MPASQIGQVVHHRLPTLIRPHPSSQTHHPHPLPPPPRPHPDSSQNSHTLHTSPPDDYPGKPVLRKMTNVLSMFLQILTPTPVSLPIPHADHPRCKLHRFIAFKGFDDETSYAKAGYAERAFNHPLPRNSNGPFVCST